MTAGASPSTGPTAVMAYVPDLMDRGRIEIAARTAGLPLTFVAHPQDLGPAVDGGARLVVVDLAGTGVLDVLPRLGAAHTIGFASHVDTALLEAARVAGCDEVLARSAIVRRLARAGEPDQQTED